MTRVKVKTFSVIRDVLGAFITPALSILSTLVFTVFPLLFTFFPNVLYVILLFFCNSVNILRSN